MRCRGGEGRGGYYEFFSLDPSSDVCRFFNYHCTTPIIFPTPAGTNILPVENIDRSVESKPGLTPKVAQVQNDTQTHTHHCRRRTALVGK